MSHPSHKCLILDSSSSPLSPDLYLRRWLLLQKFMVTDSRRCSAKAIALLFTPCSCSSQGLFHACSPLLKPPALPLPSLSAENSCNKCNEHLLITCSDSPQFTERTEAIIQQPLQNLVRFPSAGGRRSDCPARLNSKSLSLSGAAHRALRCIGTWSLVSTDVFRIFHHPACFLQVM